MKSYSCQWTKGCQVVSSSSRLARQKTQKCVANPPNKHSELRRLNSSSILPPPTHLSISPSLVFCFFFLWICFTSSRFFLASCNSIPMFLMANGAETNQFSPSYDRFLFPFGHVYVCVRVSVCVHARACLSRHN